MTFKDDSTAAFTAYIAAVNESGSQLDNMPAIVAAKPVPDIYALVTLMGLHLSSSDRHAEKGLPRPYCLYQRRKPLRHLGVNS